ncbi:MAG: cation-transporting P-type ATPase [Methanomicrobiales archaeon]|nr:cation-transporting P-type ATPase [Methanomicrobiales archaeon]
MADEGAGLSEAEAAELLRKTGPNEIFRAEPVDFFRIARHEITEPMILLLFVVGIVYALLGEEITDALTIFVIILLLVLAEVGNEYRAKKAIAALADIASPRARVRRGGQITEIDAQGVVPGDLLVLDQGTKVAADGTLLRAVDLEVDESALTGESFPRRSEPGTSVHAGTVILAGEGTARVTVTGKQTQLGEIAASARAIRPPKTRLQLAMKDLAGTLVYIAVALVLLITFLGILRGQDPRVMVLTGLSLAFATIPEELPIIITMVLGLGAYRLSQSNFLVKKIKAAETLGSATVIVTDKTGTITEGRMQVAATFPPDEHSVLRAASLALPGHSTSPLDAGVRERGRALGIPDPAFPITRKRDFGNGRLTRAVIRSPDGAPALFLTGAPEEVFSACRDVPEPFRAMLAAETEKGRRVIAVAGRSLEPGEDALPFPQIEKDLVLAGLIAFEDPPREGVRETIARAASAGIRTLMITGDHPATARFIAGAVGIESPSGRVVRGDELDGMEDSALGELLGSVSVFARTTPHHKYRIVRALQDRGEIVAVTGDGINDALALKGADIGIAMGIRGTDVARDAAAVVLADDNYVTIIHGIFEGRKFFENLRKGIVYYLSVKVALVLIFLLPVLLSLPLPFSPIQIILLELFMDLGASAGFVAEPAEERAISRRPPGREEKVLDRAATARILAKGASLFAVVTAVHLLALSHGYPPAVVQTYAFSAWIFGHIALAYFSRSEATFVPEGGFLSNRVINLWAVGATVALLAGIFLPLLQSALNLAAVSPLLLAGIAAFAAAGIAVAEAIRRVATPAAAPAVSHN